MTDNCMHARFKVRPGMQIIWIHRSKEIMRLNSNMVSLNRAHTSELKIPKWSRIRGMYYLKRGLSPK